MARENKAGLYEVGYGKPPKRTQFQKSKSGNPGGLPKGQPNVSAALVRFLAMPIRIFDNFKPRSVAEELAKRMLEIAIDGKASAMIRAFKEICDRTEGKPGCATYVHYPNEEIEIVYEGDWRPPQVELEKGDFNNEETGALYPAGSLDEGDEEGANVA
jgi:hypothetical protein